MQPAPIQSLKQVCPSANPFAPESWLDRSPSAMLFWNFFVSQSILYYKVGIHCRTWRLKACLSQKSPVPKLTKKM